VKLVARRAKAAPALEQALGDARVDAVRGGVTEAVGVAFERVGDGREGLRRGDDHHRLIGSRGRRPAAAAMTIVPVRSIEQRWLGSGAKLGKAQADVRDTHEAIDEPGDEADVGGGARRRVNRLDVSAQDVDAHRLGASLALALCEESGGRERLDELDQSSRRKRPLEARGDGGGQLLGRRRARLEGRASGSTRVGRDVDAHGFEQQELASIGIESEAGHDVDGARVRAFLVLGRHLQASDRSSSERFALNEAPHEQMEVLL
jgi:hypothetical protein